MTPQLMTPQQAKNLATLALHCHALPPDYTHFSMRAYAYRREPGKTGSCDNWGQVARAIDTHVCGTTACFAGHGPLAGIPAEPDEMWDTYVTRCFLEPDGNNLSFAHPYWSWLFSEHWPSSIPEAVKRAAWLLEKGSPPEFSEDERWDDDVEDIITLLEIVDEEAWEQFTPNLALLEQIAREAAPYNPPNV